MPQLTDNTAAEIVAGVTAAEIDELVAHVAGMTDDEIRADFHLGHCAESNALISDLRKLRTVSGR